MAAVANCWNEMPYTCHDHKPITPYSSLLVASHCALIRMMVSTCWRTGFVSTLLSLCRRLAFGKERYLDSVGCMEIESVDSCMLVDKWAWLR